MLSARFCVGEFERWAALEIAKHCYVCLSLGFEDVEGGTRDMFFGELMWEWDFLYACVTLATIRKET